MIGRPKRAIRRHERFNWAPDWSADGRYLACIHSGSCIEGVDADSCFALGDVYLGDSSGCSSILPAVAPRGVALLVGLLGLAGTCELARRARREAASRILMR